MIATLPLTILLNKNKENPDKTPDISRKDWKSSYLTPRSEKFNLTTNAPPKTETLYKVMQLG